MNPQNKPLPNDHTFAAARLLLWYKKHHIRYVPIKNLFKDCKTFARVFQCSDKDILNTLMDQKWIIPVGGGSYEINRDA
jgi:hypothetical protein